MVGGTLDLPSGLIKTANPRKIQMLQELTEDHLKMQVITRSIKTPYCENAEG